MVKDHATCPFCAIVNGKDADARVVYRGDRVTAFFPLDPATRGHTLIVPNRHVEDVLELERREAYDLADAATRVVQAVRVAVRPEGLNIIQSNGRAATQTIRHVHIHLVPRWAGDRMILNWPDGTDEDLSAQDETLALVRRSMPSEAAELTSPEDRRQHLSFIQAVITRMSQASSSAKGWLLPVETLAYGYAITNHSAAAAILGVLAVTLFGLLDANYLKQERAFRFLYDKVAQGREIPAFAMNPAVASPQGTNRSEYWPSRRDLLSWAIGPFYGPLFLVGIGIYAWLLFR